jgi:hypothetical protein
MPLVERTPSESRDKFLQRCMSDSKMITEFPDNRQRYAVCIEQAKK